MTLRAIAANDLQTIMEGELSFRWPVTVTDPAGQTNNGVLYAHTGDITELIDPDTGQMVSGRSAVAAIRIDALTAAGLGVPEGTYDSDSKPWRVDFDDINGNAHTFAVAEGNPDRTLGVINLRLEVYTAP